MDAAGFTKVSRVLRRLVLPELDYPIETEQTEKQGPNHITNATAQ